MNPSDTADRICGIVADLVSLANRHDAQETFLSVAADLLTTANAVLGHGGAA